MGKGKRVRERKERKAQRLANAGFQRSGADVVPIGGDELRSRPEYIANMKAWREAGSPPGPGEDVTGG